MLIDSGVSNEAVWLLKTDLFDEASGPYHYSPDPGQRIRFVGIDLDMAVARAASDRLREEGHSPLVVLADVRRLPFRGGIFSGVISVSTLDHFDDAHDIGRSIREIGRVQGEGGNLALAMDNPTNPEVWARAHSSPLVIRILRSDTFPIGPTVSRSLGKQLLQEAGFRVLNEEAIIHAPRYVTIRILNIAQSILPATIVSILERLVLGMEVFRNFPTRWVSGHYLAWTGIRRPVPDVDEQRRPFTEMSA